MRARDVKSEMAGKEKRLVNKMWQYASVGEL
jgi:hypothetical protein